MFWRIPSTWGISSVQVNSDAEEKRGKAAFDSAVAKSTRQFVWSAGDRGGSDRGAEDPTPVKKLVAKLNIEKHLETAVGESSHDMILIILRLITSFEKLVPDMHGQGFAHMGKQIGDKKSFR